MSKLSFKQSMKRIDEILDLLEKNEIELEEAVKLFEEGLKLAKEAGALTILAHPCLLPREYVLRKVRF